MSVTEITIDGRYQLITRIASGGMGEVYRAQDAVLGREVALKTLHPHLARDPGFVDRFRREARAAAVLNHRNIVGVYDWGSTDGTYFMVMEFVRGHNLRSLLARYRRLEPAQAVEVGLQVLSALEHAHGHGIVHRDVKPENILIDQEGTVKVADFGLARAFADSSVSQAEGTVTGTVQYLSPEQIQGRPAGPRSDVYSFGIVLFELLTGRTPYSGETSMAIAYQHLSSSVPAPTAVVPRLPEALDRAVLHATARDPDARPSSAAALREELARAGAATSPKDSGATVADLAAQIPSAEFAPDERAPTVTIPRAEPPGHRRRRILGRALIALAVLAVLASTAWAAWVYLVPHYANVPELTGLTVQRANQHLEALGLAPQVGSQVFSTEIAAGLVVRTAPPSGTRIREGTDVVLILSKGPQLFPIPRVTGMTEADASAEIVDAGFRFQVERATSENVERGRVVSQNPEPAVEVRKGSTVTITVSTGPPLVAVPGVAGQSAEGAEDELATAGFEVARTEEYSTDVAEGSVIRSDPSTGSRVAKGSTVTIVVSLGPRTFPMPNVVGSGRDQAVEELESLGLDVEVIVLPATTGNVVVGQQPTPGETVEEGLQVTVYVLGP
jgi:eukaryotic-like serine/threonine-protein kinase